jgi:hypothetical protein
MKTTFLVLLIMAVASLANASIEFVGYTSSGRTLTFALVDTDDGRAKFLELGSNFAGYRVAEYTKETETLTLTREGETLSVKLRSANFTIPAEVTGEEREKQFIAKLNEMLPKTGVGKFYFIEDYMATASQFGREIVSYDVKDGVEVIVMELPEAKRLLPDKAGLVQRMTFQVMMPCRDKKTKVKLTIR